MKQVSILIPQGHFSLVNVEGTHQIFSWVNFFLSSKNQKPIFDIHLVGLSKETKQTNGLFTIHPEFLIDEVTKTDIIILPAIHGELEENLRMNEKLIPWIVNQYQHGAEVVSLCIGSFFLASTGLLNGKFCTTHWQFANKFRMLFPEVILMDDKMITDSDGIYTSGGAYTFTNLIIYLIEKYAGRDVAVATSKAFMIDIDRKSQSPFIIFQGQKDHNDEPILKAQEFVEQNYNDKITVDKLSELFGIGRRSLERRFKKATSNTIIEYTQRVKIEVAKKQFESTRKTINEIMYEVGYLDTKAFRETFKKFTGMSPIDYRNKYNKEAVI